MKKPTRSARLLRSRRWHLRASARARTPRALHPFIGAMLAAGLLLFTTSARAQTLELPRHRQGYYVALGFHGVASSIREDGEALGTWTGTANNLRLGQMLTRRLGLGLSIDSAATAGDGQKGSIIGLGVETQLELGGNLALRGGFGLSVVQITEDAKPDADLRGTYGTGYWLGASWDWFPWKKRLTGGFALTPLVEFRVTPENNVKAFTGVFGLELTWWTGLPRNQLELPPDEAFKKP